MTENAGAAGPGRLALHAAAFALWLTSAFAVAGYVSGDRYPGYFLYFTAALIAAGLIVPLGALGALRRRFGAAGSAASAYCVLFAAALSLDVSPQLNPASALGAARLLLLVASAALAAWSVQTARTSRLGLAAALALMCLSWMLCGLLRSADAPQAFVRTAILLPPAAALAVLLPGLPRLDPRLSRLGRLGSIAAAAVLAVLPLSPRVPRPASLAAPAVKAPPGGRSALLIVLDTLRRDHMSLYGYSRNTTPALDARARAGLVFDNTTASAPWTLPSHASMFTGLWPRTHGAHSSTSPLPKQSVTLAEIAREHGYRTAGLSSNNAQMSSRLGMDQGFEEYLCRRPRLPGVQLGLARDLGWTWDERRAQYQEMPYFTAPEMTRAAIAWLARRRGAPFFLFLNYMDVHMPNAAPGSQGLPFEDEASASGAVKRGMLERLHATGELPPSLRRSLVNEYDRELIHLDHWVGELLGYVEASGLAASTLIVLTSDHGEFLGEHRLVGHGQDLYTETVDVPLIVWEPGAAAGRNARPVQGLDLFPTILRYLGLPIPEGTQGQPLTDADHPTVAEYHDRSDLAAEAVQDARVLRTLRMIHVDEHRYVQSSSGEERLFHRVADPRELRNLILDAPGVAAQARARLEAWLRDTPLAPPPSDPPRSLDPETLENLRALGYVR